MDRSAAVVAALVAQPPLAATAAEKLERVVLFFSRSLERSVSAGDLAMLCRSLSRVIDDALSFNVPVAAHGLPSLLKQVYLRRNDGSFQLRSAITMLLLSVKKAWKDAWFHSADSDEILDMANELCSSYCMRANTIADVSGVLSVVLDIIPRFYPQLKLCSLIASFEAKCGDDRLMAYFDHKRSLPPEEKIMLLVVERDRLETSSCLVTPRGVSFLINRRGVERRTNVSRDNGPQFPTDITSMVQNEVNVVQAIGSFRGNYIIAIASMSKVDPTVPELREYVQPIFAIPASDFIVGESRVSLICPFSFKRLNTPVKGQHCWHLQCFDYENYIEMNSRKPSWRCPFCNQSASFIDLQIDSKMVKILSEVEDDINEVVISTDGSLIVERPNYVDLTMEEDAGVDATASFRELEVLDGVPLDRDGSLASLIPKSILNPNALLPTLKVETTAFQPHQLPVITQDQDHQDARHILNPALQGVGLGRSSTSNWQRTGKQVTQVPSNQSRRGSSILTPAGSASVSDDVTQSTSEERWQPTGRMRGSLTESRSSGCLSYSESGITRGWTRHKLHHQTSRMGRVLVELHLSLDRMIRAS